MDATDGDCSSASTVMTYLLVALSLISFFITVGLSFCQRRKQYKMDCLFGFPGVLQPLDFFSGQPSRLVLVAGLTAFSGHILQVVLEQPLFVHSSDVLANKIVTVLIRIAWIMLVAVFYYPLLAATHLPLPILGYIIGMCYSPLLIVFLAIWCRDYVKGCLFEATSTPNPPSETEGRLYIVALLPIFISLGVVFLWNVVKLVQEMLDCCRCSCEEIFEPTPSVHTCAYSYVKALFTKKRETKFPRRKDRFKRLREIRELRKASRPDPEINKKKAPRELWYKKGFGFPVTFLAAIMASIVICYEATFFLIPKLLDLADDVNTLIGDLANKSSGCEGSGSGESNESTIDKLLDDQDRIVNGVKAFLLIAPLFALIICFLQAFPLIKSVRNHLLRAYRGDFDFLKEELRNYPTAYTMRSWLRYPAYQIAYFIWAWALYMVTVWFLAILLGVILALAKLAVEVAILVVAILCSGGVLMAMVQCVQIVSTRMCFVVPDSKELKGLALTNRRVINAMMYLAYAYNGFPGIFSASLRTLFGGFLGLVRAPRMDKPGLPSGREHLDFGYKVYVGYIQCEAIQNNPIIHVFLDLLYNRVQDHGGLLRKPLSVNAEAAESRDQDNDGLDGEEEYPKVSHQAFNRWHLAMILLKYESIRKFRRRPGSNHGNGHVPATDVSTPSPHYLDSDDEELLA